MFQVQTNEEDSGNDRPSAEDKHFEPSKLALGSFRNGAPAIIHAGAGLMAFPDSLWFSGQATTIDDGVLLSNLPSMFAG
jgi:hypothetical protein